MRTWRSVITAADPEGDLAKLEVGKELVQFGNGEFTVFFAGPFGLAELDRQPGTLGVIFRKAQNKIQDPAKLKRLVSDLIGKETLDDPRRRCEGRRLRGPARQERRGREVRRGPVLHATLADQGDRGRDAPDGRQAGVRPGRRHRRLPPSRLRADEVRQPGPRREEVPAGPGAPGLGDRRCDRPAVRDELAAARDQRAGKPEPGYRG